MSEALFYEDAVLRVITAIVRAHGLGAEAEDHTQNIVIRCIRRVRKTGQPPKDIAQAIVIARHNAEQYCAEVLRKQSRRGETNVGSTESADDHAQQDDPKPDPIDIKRIVDASRRVLSEEQLARLIDVGAGVKQADLARESGTAPATMRKRTETDRKAVRFELKKMGYAIAGIGALVASIALIYFGPFRGSGGDSAGGNPTSKQHMAAEYRETAARACIERKWDQCENALDDAAGLDPESERRADVRELRGAIAAGRAAGAGEAGAQQAPPTVDR